MTTLARLMIALGLATASLLAVDPAPAHACGGYVMNPDDAVLGVASQELDGDLGARLGTVRWLEDGTASVQVTWATYQPGVRIAQILYFAIGDNGRWRATSHSYKFTLYEDHSADAREPTPRRVLGSRLARLARR